VEVYFPLVETDDHLRCYSDASICTFWVWLVYLNSVGQTEFTLFGQTFKSANVGIAAIFIAAVTFVLTIRAILRTIRHTTTHGG
jgi:hypothetical protein